ncbi:hypothetical protein B0J18DRAFT_419052 [Chaetomium sp. MPI-SDFR-AT-0129]|nr:hypothetical protein B0J18DRAFT_419052 [Chaetomium sp. MPI-SDFR-AT-0129]
MISAQMTIHERYKADQNMDVPDRVKAWGHLHDFIELSHHTRFNQEWGGEYLTHWHMGRSILRVFPEVDFGYRHPNLYHDPPCCQNGESHEMPCATKITDEYWTRILAHGEPHEELWPKIHSRLESRREDKNVLCPVYCHYTIRRQL